MLNFLFNNTNKYRTNFDDYPDGVAFIRENGEIIYNNRRFHNVFAINDSYAPSANINEILPGFMEMLIHTVGNSQVTDVIKYTLNNDVAYLEYTVSFEKKDSVFIVAFRDVTQTQKKNIELVNLYETNKKLNKNKNDFLVKITPELTSPLQSIFGFSQALLEGLGGELNEKQLKYIKIISKNSKELGDLTDRILLLSKIESGNYVYDYKNIDIVNIIKQVRNDYAQFFEEKHIEFNVDFSSLTKRQCFADEKALKIIISNFVESALNSTEIGSVKITVSHPDINHVERYGYKISDDFGLSNFIQFKIVDTGSGFIDDEFNALFNIYDEVELGNKKNLSRSLGLTVAKHFIENINGKIWGRSVPMEGTEFNFIIPVNASEN